MSHAMYEVGEVVKTPGSWVEVRNRWLMDDGTWVYQSDSGMLWRESDLVESSAEYREASEFLTAVDNLNRAMSELTYPLRRAAEGFLEKVAPYLKLGRRGRG